MLSPLLYEQLVWDHEQAITDPINLAIKSFNLGNVFNGENINFQVELFNESLMNSFSNFILKKIKTFRDSNNPQINDNIKNSLVEE